MKHFASGKCPVCHSPLHLNRLACPECKAEYPVDAELSPYDYLNDAQAEFLRLFLQNRGSLKAVGEQCGQSYPTVKKRLDDLLAALGYLEETEPFELEEIDMSNFSELDPNSTKPSEIIRKKLYDAGGNVTIPQLQGAPCNIVFASNGREFTSDKLNRYKYCFEFTIFDHVVDFLLERPQYKAVKGTARGPEDKVGYGKCTEDTVSYAIATRYFGKSIGESTLDPCFVIVAMLAWAGIVNNERGYIQLTGSYLALRGQK